MQRIKTPRIRNNGYPEDWRPLQIYISPELRDALARLKITTRQPTAVLVRALITAELAKHS